ncbi:MULTISPECIES: ribosomal protein S18-alanine N-acetyltransferase [Rheinheimera]|uniref:ribosomal protein S18-alanine N-acetyltransferase n=1 Tax=Rheinheimera TaxID=67575 RepID=UPI00104B03EC|nr:ribosomal protein S18-alanine N-acetyltransferase [Rheinheimera sp. D18]QBL09986.1 ribosomal-protein-alanine N-acetyltransferase [Rheinheimera sp. D18]
MIFKPLTIADIPAVVVLEQAANVYPWTQYAFSSSFTNSYFNVKLLNAENDILGFYIAQLMADQVELFNICVAKAAQGQGFGKALLQHFLSQGQTQGAAEALLEVRSSNFTAIALYQNLGFAINGVRKGYYTAATGTEDALLMHRALI